MWQSQATFISAERRRMGGMALLMVLVLIAVSSVIGLSYLYSATIKTAGTRNMLMAERAECLAESGLEHGLYVVENRGDAESASPWGPFTIDDEPGTYTFSINESGWASGLYYITSDATVAGIQRRRTLSVLLRPYGYIDLDHALLVGSGSCTLPASAQITGDVHANGNAYVMAAVSGNVSATLTAADWGGQVSGYVTSGASCVHLPYVSHRDYLSYVWYEDEQRDAPDVSGEAVEKTTTMLTGSDALCGGGAVTSANPGGVVHLVPPSGSQVRIGDNVNFQGTLVVDGDIVLDGTGIVLTAQSRFPAIVASGQVIINSNAGAEIDGMIIADGGITSSGEGSHVTITGGLLTRTMGMSDELKGTQIVQFDSSRCFIYDFSGGTSIVDAN